MHWRPARGIAQRSKDSALLGAAENVGKPRTLMKCNVARVRVRQADVTVAPFASHSPRLLERAICNRRGARRALAPRTGPLSDSPGTGLAGLECQRVALRGNGRPARRAPRTGLRDHGTCRAPEAPHQRHLRSRRKATIAAPAAATSHSSARGEATDAPVDATQRCLLAALRATIVAGRASSRRSRRCARRRRMRSGRCLWARHRPQSTRSRKNGYLGGALAGDERDCSSAGRRGLSGSG